MWIIGTEKSDQFGLEQTSSKRQESFQTYSEEPMIFPASLSIWAELRTTSMDIQSVSAESIWCDGRQMRWKNYGGMEGSQHLGSGKKLGEKTEAV